MITRCWMFTAAVVVCGAISSAQTAGGGDQLKGAWRVVDIIDGGFSAKDSPTDAERTKDATVKITAKQFAIVTGKEKDEYAITAVDPKHRPAAIDLYDADRRITYCGIYKRDGKRLLIWTLLADPHQGMG